MALLAALAWPAVGVAQPPVRRPPQADRMMLERQIMQRFAREVGSELRLSEDRRSRLEQWLIQSNQRRRDLAREANGLRRQLAEAVRSTNTSDAEFERLLTQIREVRQRELDQLGRDEDELAQTLSPRQRAEFYLRLARLQERIRQMVAERGGGDAF